MRFMSRTFHLACALLLATAATPLHAAKADRILIVVSGEGRDQGKTRPGYEFDELSQAWLIFQANADIVVYQDWTALRPGHWVAAVGLALAVLHLFRKPAAKPERRQRRPAMASEAAGG